MPNKTYYAKKEDIPTIAEASRLLKFYEGKSLSEMIAEQCKKIVKKYGEKK